MKTAAPDLIVSDLVMPVMDGLDLLASLRNDPCSRGIPFLALTARVEENLEQEVLQRGADLYMAKPFLLDELRASVAGLLHRRPNARVAGDCA